jgi:hypothetical protein
VRDYLIAQLGIRPGIPQPTEWQRIAIVRRFIKKFECTAQS